MRVVKIGTIAWSKGRLQLSDWSFDLEGQDITYDTYREYVRCAIEEMLEDCHVAFDVAEEIPFEVERIALDAIFSAAVTSSPSMMRELMPSRWWQLKQRFKDWWYRHGKTRHD